MGRNLYIVKFHFIKNYQTAILSQSKNEMKKLAIFDVGFIVEIGEIVYGKNILRVLKTFDQEWLLMAICKSIRVEAKQSHTVEMFITGQVCANLFLNFSNDFFRREVVVFTKMLEYEQNSLCLFFI
jgi:hypothetical protein